MTVVQILDIVIPGFFILILSALLISLRIRRGDRINESLAELTFTETKSVSKILLNAIIFAAMAAFEMYSSLAASAIFLMFGKFLELKSLPVRYIEEVVVFFDEKGRENNHVQVRDKKGILRTFAFARPEWMAIRNVEFQLRNRVEEKGYTYLSASVNGVTLKRFNFDDEAIELMA